MPTNTFLVTAATGRQGGAAVRLLLRQGKMVHALVRDVESPASHALRKLGVVLFQGDFNSTGAINDEIQGVDGTFLNLFPTQDISKQAAQAQFFVDTAKAAGTATEGTLSHAFHPNARKPYLDAADVGQFAAAALLNPGMYAGHEIDLCSQNLTIGEVGIG